MRFYLARSFKSRNAPTADNVWAGKLARPVALKFRRRAFTAIGAAKNWRAFLQPPQPLKRTKSISPNESSAAMVLALESLTKRGFAKYAASPIRGRQPDRSPSF